MQVSCAPGGSVIWILLAVNAFGGSFELEAASGGDLGLANYSEAGHRAPAPPEVPTAPNPSLATLASFQSSNPTGLKHSEGALAAQLIASLNGVQLGGAMHSPKAVAADRLSESSLATIVQNVRREVYSESRLAYMQRAVEGRKLGCKQLATLLGLLTFSDDRLKLVEAIGGQVVDAENYPSLYRFFPFESDREVLSSAF
jgi:hypothetical protein